MVMRYTSIAMMIIKLIMQNRSINSSINTKSLAGRSATSEEHRLKRKIPYKIEICNQDLDEAIREVRSHIKDNPEWRLNVKAVVSQYPPSRSSKVVNDSQRMDGLQQQLPISEAMIFPATAEASQSPFDRLKFTQRKRREFEIRTREIKERRMQLEVSLLEKQMKVKLERKIQENQRLKEKQELMREIEQHREESLRMHEVERNRKRTESSLLHESSVANVKMIRKSRSRSQRQLINELKSRADQSAQALHFKDIQMSKSKLQQKEIILTRYKNLRSASQSSLRRRSIHIHPNPVCPT